MLNSKALYINLVFLLSVGAISFTNDDSTGSIFGRVDFTGRKTVPESINLILEGTLLSIKVDPNGYFFFSDIMPGEYNLRERIGYRGCYCTGGCSLCY